MPVLRIGVEQDEETGYKALKEKYIATVNDAGAREAYVAGMSRVKSEALIRDFLDFSFSGAIPTQDIHGPAANLSHNATARPIYWKWLRDNWTMVEGRLKGTTVVFDRFIRMSLVNFVTKQDRDEIEAFFKDKDTKPFERALIQTLDSIESNYKYRERDQAKVVEWLNANGYSA